MMKDLQPLRDEADHAVALAEIEQLWGALRGMLKGSRLDVLARLIEAYEAQEYPMDPPAPMDAIRFRMEQQGLASKD